MANFINHLTNQYPFTRKEIEALHPTTSFSEPFTPPHPFYPVLATPQPTYDSDIEYLVEKTPTLDLLGNYVQVWDVKQKFPNAAERAEEKKKKTFERNIRENEEIKKQMEKLSLDIIPDIIFNRATKLADYRTKFAALEAKLKPEKD